MVLHIEGRKVTFLQKELGFCNSIFIVNCIALQFSSFYSTKKINILSIEAKTLELS